MTQRELITLDEAAEIVSATNKQLRAKIRRGLLPASKVGKSYRISPADLLALYRPVATEARPGAPRVDAFRAAGLVPSSRT